MFDELSNNNISKHESFVANSDILSNFNSPYYNVFRLSNYNEMNQTYVILP